LCIGAFGVEASFDFLFGAPKKKLGSETFTTVMAKVTTN
jgi:hypothetical protein